MGFLRHTQVIEMKSGNSDGLRSQALSRCVTSFMSTHAVFTLVGQRVKYRMQNVKQRPTGVLEERSCSHIHLVPVKQRSRLNGLSLNVFVFFVFFRALCSLLHLHLISPNGVLTFCSSKEKHCQAAANGDQERLLFWDLSSPVQPAILP